MLNERYRVEVVDPENECLRKQFNHLIKETFGFDFENWYQGGYWPASYLPHVLLEDDKVIANISVNVQLIKIGNQTKTFVQIGAVATAKAYRQKGFGRLLMIEVMNKWEAQCDQIYLYAHDGVASFYPKFGFQRSKQYYDVRDLEASSGKIQPISMRKLVLENKQDLQKLNEKARLGNPFSELSMVNGESLIMFYTTYFQREDIYYLETYDLVVIAQSEAGILSINEILGNATASLDTVISTMITADIHRVELGFAPKEREHFQILPLIEENNNLFILNVNEDVTLENRWMFPILTRT